MDEVKRGLGELVGHEVETAHPDPIARQLVEQARVEIHRKHRAALPTRSASMRADRASARADIQTARPLADANRVQLTDGQRVMVFLQQPKPRPLHISRALLGENVFTHVVTAAFVRPPSAPHQGAVAVGHGQGPPGAEPRRPRRQAGGHARRTSGLQTPGGAGSSSSATPGMLGMRPGRAERLRVATDGAPLRGPRNLTLKSVTKRLHFPHPIPVLLEVFSIPRG